MAAVTSRENRESSLGSRYCQCYAIYWFFLQLHTVSSKNDVSLWLGIRLACRDSGLIRPPHQRFTEFLKIIEDKTLSWLDLITILQDAVVIINRGPRLTILFNTS